MDHINVDGLRAFLAVARHGHLGHAAEALGADQSTVSRKIARLEEEVGVALFERVRRSIRLTPAREPLRPPGGAPPPRPARGHRRHRGSRLRGERRGAARLPPHRGSALAARPAGPLPRPPPRGAFFEVIAGTSMSAEGPAKSFGFVQTYDTKPKRRLFEVLRSQGMQANQQVTFVTDGADDVRDLPLFLNPQADHQLDWFHVTMRLTVMTQMAKGLRATPTDADRSVPADLSVSVAHELERLTWFLWHGNVFRALQTVEDLEFDLAAEDASPEQRRLLQAVREFDGYIRANAGSIPNYGELYRAGEIISSALAESTINQVVSKRMVKKQQMRWTPRGAHLLLQVRTRVLNEELVDDFHRWYPGFTHRSERQELTA